jgi:hypothetical protein
VRRSSDASHPFHERRILLRPRLTNRHVGPRRFLPVGPQVRKCDGSVFLPLLVLFFKGGKCEIDSTVVSFPAGRVCHLILFVGNKTAQVGKQTSSVHGGDDAMCVCARARKQQQSGGLVPLRKLGSSSSLSCTVAALSIIHGIQRHPPIRYSGPTPTGTPCSDSSSCPLSPVAGVIFSILPCQSAGHRQHLNLLAKFGKKALARSTTQLPPAPMHLSICCRGTKQEIKRQLVRSDLIPACVPSIQSLVAERVNESEF